MSQIQPDIIQAQSLTTGGIAVYLSGFRPYIALVRGSDVMAVNRQNFIIQKLIRQTIIGAQAIVGSSMALKNAVMKIGGDPRKFHLIRAGVDADVFKWEKNDLKQKLNLKNKKIIFCPRVIGSVYNTDILLKAFERLVNNNNLKLALLDWPTIPTYYRKIINYIRSHKLSERVLFLPPVENPQMADYYNLADVVVSIPKLDGMPVSFLEAMACQKKIVVSDLPYLNDWPKAKYWLAPVGDIIKTAQAISRALNFPQKNFKLLSKINRQIIIQDADPTKNFEKFDPIYQRLLKNNRKT